MKMNQWLWYRAGKTESIFLIGAVMLLAIVARAETESKIYDRLYPYYAEFCGATQISKHPGFGASVIGGKGGHGVMYLHGACRDKSVPYPRIKMCDAETDAAGLERGVGVSVNSDYRNANWIAVESKDFFFRGTLPEGGRLDRAVYFETRTMAEKMGVLDGIEFHPELFKKAPAGMSEREYMFEDTMGTDYAISFGRNLYCVRLPLKKEMLPPMVDWLNAQNDKYRGTGREYQWSGIKDNCTHVTHNALAEAEVWSANKTNRALPVQIWNLTLPSNDFVDLMKRASKLPLDQPLRLFRDKNVRESLLTYGWLPTQHGATVELFPLIQDNELYRTQSTFIFLEWPLLKQKTRQFRKMLKDSKLTELQTNFEWYRARYRKALDKMPELEFYLMQFRNPRTNPEIDAREFTRFYQALRAHLEGQLADVEAKLAELAAFSELR